MIDTHCHLTFEGLYERVEDVIAAAHEAGVDRMISVGTSPTDARQAVEVAERHEGIFATVGAHPLHVDGNSDAEALKPAVRELASHPKVVAVGEMGLDRHYDEPPVEWQRPMFQAQLEVLGEAPDLPGIIHNREATDQTLGMIRDAGIAGERLVFHCFSGSADELDAILDLGAMVSFTGIVTFKNLGDLAAASDRVPLDRLMIETDSPFLTPAPHRKVRPNQPRYVVEVARHLAHRRGLSPDAFTAATDANADRFFKLPPRVNEPSQGDRR